MAISPVFHTINLSKLDSRRSAIWYNFIQGSYSLPTEICVSVFVNPYSNAYYTQTQNNNINYHNSQSFYKFLDQGVFCFITLCIFYKFIAMQWPSI
jgi:hypothetical protein